MAEITHICTHCGYEGKPVKPPTDETYGGQSDASKAIMRVANLIVPGLGLIIRPLALFLMLPYYLLRWLLAPWFSPNKHCPNCGLPLMVTLKSDAGFVAKRKRDVKDGLVSFDPYAPKPVTSFGKQVVLPGDELKNQKAPLPPKPERLGTLEDLLKEETPPAPEAEPVAAEPEKPKKIIDPEQW